MDVVTTGFYGVVCGILAAFAPSFPAVWIRAAIGAVVGVVSALALPSLRVAMGY